MLRISPKLIDVEGNRVGDFIYKGEAKGYDQLQKKGKELGFFKYHDGLSCDKADKRKNKVPGRFPTQLFTNIKNDKYKYVKFILDK